MKRGSSNITNVKRGSTDIQKVYRGTNLVWSKDIPISYIYVFRNDNTNTVRKYDLDGNLVATLSNANANYPSGIFSVKEDDGVIYGGRKTDGDTTTLLLKLNPDLTFTRAASSLILQDIQVGPNCLFTVSDERLQSRTFGAMSVINQTGIIFDNNEEDVAVIYSDPYSNNLFLANEIEDEGVRSFDKTNTTITQNWFRADSNVNVRTSIFTHPDYVNNFWISNSTGSRRYTKDNSLAGVNLSNLDIQTRDVVILSNGNIVYGFVSNLICRTITNADANSTTNVFSISQAGSIVRSLCKDDDDNIYVITSNAIRKYTSSGTLVWDILSQSSLTYIVSNKY
jgi:hypothetical protein